mmetsp:Transcript_27978/g.70797  ORF Transcript_27978/g.70797 Transcript_27978/m.70797 type:complete len:306 (+) Transcript_27978:3551-4468(+)
MFSSFLALSVTKTSRFALGGSTRNSGKKPTFAPGFIFPPAPPPPPPAAFVASAFPPLVIASSHSSCPPFAYSDLSATWPMKVSTTSANELHILWNSSLPASNSSSESSAPLCAMKFFLSRDSFVNSSLLLSFTHSLITVGRSVGFATSIFRLCCSRACTMPKSSTAQMRNTGFGARTGASTRKGKTASPISISTTASRSHSTAARKNRFSVTFPPAGAICPTSGATPSTASAPKPGGSSGPRDRIRLEFAVTSNRVFPRNGSSSFSFCSWKPRRVSSAASWLEKRIASRSSCVRRSFRDLWVSWR